MSTKLIKEAKAYTLINNIIISTKLTKKAKVNTPNIIILFIKLIKKAEVYT